MELAWLKDYSEEALGPIQHDEAILLYGVVKSTRPQSVLEFGSCCGYSTRVWLEAGVPKVFAVDALIMPPVEDMAKEFAPRLKTMEMDMRKYEAEMTGPVDFVFFDASHDFEVNKMVFEKLTPRPKMVAVHDTGTWASEFIRPIHKKHATLGIETSDGLMHQPGEVKFADWLEKTVGLRRLDFHSKNTLRHGLSIFQ
jgi:hypothetical protein